MIDFGPIAGGGYLRHPSVTVADPVVTLANVNNAAGSGWAVSLDGFDVTASSGSVEFPMLQYGQGGTTDGGTSIGLMNADEANPTASDGVPASFSGVQLQHYQGKVLGKGNGADGTLVNAALGTSDNQFRTYKLAWSWIDATNAQWSLIRDGVTLATAIAPRPTFARARLFFGGSYWRALIRLKDTPTLEGVSLTASPTLAAKLEAFAERVSDEFNIVRGEIPEAGAVTLDGLGDVATGGAASGQLLGFDGSQWEPVDPPEGSGQVYRGEWAPDALAAVYDMDGGIPSVFVPTIGGDGVAPTFGAASVAGVSGAPAQYPQAALMQTNNLRTTAFSKLTLSLASLDIPGITRVKFWTAYGPQHYNGNYRALFANKNGSVVVSSNWAQFMNWTQTEVTADSDDVLDWGLYGGTGFDSGAGAQVVALTGVEVYASADPYMVDQVVTRNGKLWRSLVNNNTTTPGAAGAQWVQAIDPGVLLLEPGASVPLGTPVGTLVYRKVSG